MSGTQKKYLAIAGTVGVAIATALLQSMPDNHAVHTACEIALTVLGALGFVFPVSVKAPAQPSGLEQPPVQK